jgi:hypothetical protein
MSRRSSGRSLVGLILEIGFIALVVSVIPKLNFKAQAPVIPPAASAPDSAVPWWHAEPSTRATSWQVEEPQPVNVQQTLEKASRNLIGSAAEYAGRTAEELLAPPVSQQPSEPVPHEWRRY